MRLVRSSRVCYSLLVCISAEQSYALGNRDESDGGYRESKERLSASAVKQTTALGIGRYPERRHRPFGVWRDANTFNLGSLGRTAYAYKQGIPHMACNLRPRSHGRFINEG